MFDPVAAVDWSNRTYGIGCGTDQEQMTLVDGVYANPDAATRAIECPGPDW